MIKPPWYDVPMGVFVVGEHVDVHGRRVLYRQTRIWFGGCNYPTTWLRFVKYLEG